MTNKVKTTLIGWIVWIVCTSSLHAQVVTTQYGPVQGSLNGTVYQFLGIPFAKPPVDTLRWKAPQDPEPWTEVLSTIGFAPACPQKAFESGDSAYTLEGNEDCLYLNIWTPQTGTGNRPVMVFIHGGGNQQGSARQIQGGTEIFHGKNLSERGNVVVVTIQYRLGPLGFLVHPGLEAENMEGISGNYAVLDQIMALKWIQNNISNFGGDPSKVMIFGESAGGVNVGNLLVSPLAVGLFHRACIESASPVINEYIDSKSKGIAFVDTFVTTGTDVEKIAHLRSLSADSLLFNETSPLAGGVAQMNWQPVIDDYVFTGKPSDIFQSGLFNKVPLIIGSNAEEMSRAAPQTVVPAMVKALINLTVPEEYREEADLLYPSGADNTEARQSYVGILTDLQFTSTARRTAQCINLNQTEPVWRYFFTHRHTLEQLEDLGSYHGMELFYVFNNWENATLGKGPLFKPQDDSVQNAMLKYWTNFAATGDPNGSGLVNWPTYQSESDCYIEIRATPEGSQCGLRSPQSDLWDKVAGYTGCSASVGIQKKLHDKLLTGFPNPTTDLIHLDVPDDLPVFEVVLYNSTGQAIRVIKPADRVDLSGQDNGVYFLQIVTQEKIYTLKVIKTE